MSANGEDQSINHKFNSTSSSNSSRHTRHKRYVAHINPIYRNFDFLKKDGEYFDRKIVLKTKCENFRIFLSLTFYVKSIF